MFLQWGCITQYNVKDSMLLQIGYTKDAGFWVIRRQMTVFSQANHQIDCKLITDGLAE
jgi:hypothetical protein